MPLTLEYRYQKKFILHWGEMGNAWGINRTVAQVHALLFVSPKPLYAEEIQNTLAVARSNREHQPPLSGRAWGIVRVVARAG